MVAKIIEGLLPGTRSLRPPVISGILWGLFLWILFSDHIPLVDQSQGWTQQLYIVLGAVGPVVSVGIVSILVFVLGASLGNLSDAISLVVGRAALGAQRAFVWQRYARKIIRQLRKEKAGREKTVTNLETELSTLGPKKSKNDPILVTLRNSLKMEQKRIGEIEYRLGFVSKSRRHSLLLPNSAEFEAVIGRPPATAHEGDLEYELVEVARTDGRHAMMEEKSVVLDPRLFVVRSSSNEEEIPEPDLGREFLSEIETDPLQVLQSLDESLFLEVDRRRAEREVRLTFATPLMALVALAAFQWNNPWWWSLILLPLAMIVRYSFEQAQEKTHVLRLMRLNSLRTPALRRAYELGRRDVLEVIKQQQLAEQEWERAKEREQRRRERDKSEMEARRREQEAVDTN